MLKRNEITINRRLASGELPSFKIGSSVRIPCWAVERMRIAEGIA